MVLREFLFFFALALTTYDALQNAPPKISEVPPAIPFFDEGSLVTDWYRGELSKAFSVITAYDVSFVMYYAPWDAECQHVKSEFDKAAQIMFKQVHFAAINCWNPGGECRLHHVHISMWPIIIVHTNLWKTLIYSGPKDFVSMVKFLHQVIKPMTHLTSNNSLLELVSICDTVVVGFTPMDNISQPYNVFYNVALKYLEFDSLRDNCFGVVTSENLAADMGIKTVPSIKLFLWNNTLEYPSYVPFNEENISNWIATNSYRHASWLMPSWRKSFKMRAIFNRGPVLIMFTPRNLFYERVPYYDLLWEIALEYNNCGDSHTRTITKLRMLQRHKYTEYELNKNAICRDFNTISDKITLKYPPQRSYKKNTMKHIWLNKTSCKKDAPKANLNFFSLSENSYFHGGLYVSSEESLNLPQFCHKNDEESCSAEQEHFSNFLGSYENFENVIENINIPESFEDFSTSMYDTTNDPRSATNLLKRYFKETCTKIELARNVCVQALPVVGDGAFKIEGLRCNTNNTLSFIAIDTLLNPQFAESLGIDITSRKDKTAVVILDNKHESQYLLEKPLGERSLREFIYNFTMNLLPRNLRSEYGNSKFTHYYGSDKDFENILSNNNNASSEIKTIRKDLTSDYESQFICVKELNTSSFQSFISQKDKALLLAMCNSGSGSCNGLLSLSLLSVARSFRSLKDQFQIARIDASINDLPWEYTVSKYPTLVFFPAGKKENSRSYPEDQQVTVEGILGFVLSGFETPVRLHAQVLLCNQTLDDVNMKKCLKNTRQSVVGSIGNMLKLWRRNHDSAVKNILLRRLQCLRSVAINLGALNTTKVPLTHPLYKSFSESIQTLTKIWRMTVVPLNRRQKHSIDYENL